MSRRGSDRIPRIRLHESEELFRRIFESNRTNAIGSWLLIGVLGLVFLESLLDLDWQWIVFTTVIGVIVLLPPVTRRDWCVMLPWELLVLALFPILVRGLFGGTVGIFASYIAVSGLALIVTVELHRYTTLRVTHWFAVAFVVLTTLASVAAWSIFRWNLDRYLGTQYLTSNDALMREFFWVTLAGLIAGILFDAYFRRRDFLLRRIIRWIVTR